jgi:hypothetical protein
MFNTLQGKNGIDAVDKNILANRHNVIVNFVSSGSF